MRYQVASAPLLEFESVYSRLSLADVLAAEFEPSVVVERELLGLAVAAAGNGRVPPAAASSTGAVLIGLKHLSHQLVQAASSLVARAEPSELVPAAVEAAA